MKIGATVRNARSRAPCADSRRVPGAVAGVACRGVGANCATWRRRAATVATPTLVCSISAISPWLATSVSPVRGALQSAVSTGPLAILGVSDACIASNPSDMNEALTALEAGGSYPGNAAERECRHRRFLPVAPHHAGARNSAEPGDLITHVTLPPPAEGGRSLYSKLRDRASYEFALASAAVVVTVTGGRVSHARIALGGVGTKPWRSREGEAALCWPHRRIRQASGAPQQTHSPAPGRKPGTPSRSNWRNAASSMR